MEQLQKTYGILMEKEIDQEVMTMCNFSDFIEQRGKEEGKVEATLVYVKKTDAENRCQCGGCYEYTGC